MTHEEADREACNVGLKTSAYLFFFIYGNAAINVTIWGSIFKLLGFIDVSWPYIFGLFIAPAVFLGSISALYCLGKLLQFPMELFKKLVCRQKPMEENSLEKRGR